MKRCRLIVLLMLSACAQMQALARVPKAPSFLRTEHIENPIGLTTTKPSFSWWMNDADRDERQTAYQIFVATSLEDLANNKAVAWQTDWVKSNRQNAIYYNGRPLKARTVYYWKIRLKDKDGQVSPYSAAASFETGLFFADWQAQWIYLPDDLPQPRFDTTIVNYKDSTVHPLYASKNWDGDGWQTWTTGKLLRREFFIGTKPVRKARLHIANLGYYEAYINGKKVGNHVLDPGLTDCDKRVLSVTYDVANHLRKGKNAIGLMLNTGRLLNCKDGLRLQLEIDYADGSRTVILSDEQWKGSLQSPVKAVTGWGISKEFFDATKEQKGWNQPDFSDDAWTAVSSRPLSLAIDAQLQPIRVVQTLKPQLRVPMGDSIRRFNMGQNFSGWAQLKVRGKRGQVLRVQYADGEENEMDFNQEDSYVLSGEGEETLAPSFTYHGFQWVTVKSDFTQVELIDVVGCVVHTDLRSTGNFQCSDSLLNQLYRNNQWSLRTNVHSVYTDCPSREKVPWLGQWSQGSLQENFDMGAFFQKWLDDLKTAQLPDGRIADKLPGRIHYGWNGTDPVWVSEAVIGSWYIYQAYADTQQLADIYPTLQRLMNYYGTLADSTGVIRASKWGDHIGLHKPTAAYLSTAYYAFMADVMSKMSGVLRKGKDSIKYVQLFNQLRQTINRLWFDGRQYDNGSQGAQAVALHFGLVPEERREAVIQRLEQSLLAKDFHPSTGGATTYNLMNALAAIDKPEWGYKLATQTTYPGWGHWVANGATTSWEQWQVKGPSKNHGWLGAYLGSWMVKALGGVNRVEAGGGMVVLRAPLLPQLNSASTQFETPAGRWHFAWHSSTTGWQLTVSLPPNSRALLHIPATAASAITEGGNQLWKKQKATGTFTGGRWVGNENGYTVWEIGSGNYSFRVK